MGEEGVELILDELRQVGVSSVFGLGEEGCGVRLHGDEQLALRRIHWKPLTPRLDSGYWKLYTDTVLQADEGADLDFLRGRRGAFVPRDNH